MSKLVAKLFKMSLVGAMIDEKSLHFEIQYYQYVYMIYLCLHIDHENMS